MHRFLFRIERRDREGQGLVEYALILVLVAIVVIAILTLFGQSVANAYCGVVYELDKGAKPVSVCKAPIVKCVIQNSSPSSFSVQAQIVDPDSAPSGGSSGNYNYTGMRVQFYVNDTPRLRGETSNIPVEQAHHYCFPGGNGATCDTTTSGQVLSGDTVKAIATDVDGNTGNCSVRVP